MLLAAAGAGLLRPAFGAGSAARHDLVARRLDLDLPRLRRDVDVRPRCGRRRARGRPAHAARCWPRRHSLASLTPMQGSVHRFDPATGAGRCCSTTAPRCRSTREAFARSGLRLLRLGQRLTVELAGDGADLRAVGLRLHGDLTAGRCSAALVRRTERVELVLEVLVAALDQPDAVHA